MLVSLLLKLTLLSLSQLLHLKFIIKIKLAKEYSIVYHSEYHIQEQRKSRRSNIEQRFLWYIRHHQGWVAVNWISWWSLHIVHDLKRFKKNIAMIFFFKTVNYIKIGKGHHTKAIIHITKSVSTWILISMHC